MKQNWKRMFILMGAALLPWQISWGYSTTYDYYPAPTLYSPVTATANATPAIAGKPVYIASTSIFFDTQAGSPVSYFQGDYGTFIGYSPSSGVATMTSEEHGATGVPYGTSATPNVSSSWFGSHGLSAGSAREITSNGLLFYSVQSTYTLSNPSNPFSVVWSTTPSILPSGSWVDLNELVQNQAAAAPPLGNLALRQNARMASLTWRVQ